MKFHTYCRIESFSQAVTVESNHTTVILTARGTQTLIYEELADHVTYEMRYSSANDDNDEMEDEENARNDEKRETDETADDRDEVLCGYGQADDEGFGAEECRYDELQNEAIGQEEGSLLSSILSGFIMP